MSPSSVNSDGGVLGEMIGWIYVQVKLCPADRNKCANVIRQISDMLLLNNQVGNKSMFLRFNTYMGTLNITFLRFVMNLRPTFLDSL